jgi:hypothetical protein
VINTKIISRCYISINISFRLLYYCSIFSIYFEIDLILNLIEIRPTIILFFGKKFLIIKCNLKCSNNRKSDIFIGTSVKIFILCWFDSNKLIWHSIAINFNIWEFLIDKLFNWINNWFTLDINGLIFLLIMMGAPTVRGTWFTVLNMHYKFRLLSHFLIIL